MGMLKILEKLPIEDINSKNVDGSTPLHFASMNGKAITCNWLLQNGADVNATNNANETSLDLALMFNYPLTELVLEDFHTIKVTETFTRKHS